MEKIKLTFLGTADSVPTKLRSHSAILINYKNETILIDCGEGTQRQFRCADISVSNLSRILITHWHGDHILGLPGLFQTLGMLGYKKRLEIYGPIGTKHYINLLREFVNIVIPLDIYEVENRAFIDKEDFYIETKKMEHSTKVNAYAFILKDKRRLDKNKLKKYKLPNSSILKELQQGRDVVYNGKKIRSNDVSYIEEGKKICFILDTKINKNAIEIAKGSDILVIESSFSIVDKVKAEEFKHLTAVDAATIAKKASVKNLILTHISQRYEADLRIIEREARKVFKNVKIARDFDTIIV